MSLYAIGDLHLHFQSPLKARAQMKERIWRNHEEVFRRNCAKLLREDDTLVLAGDHSWGRTLAECEEDLRYILQNNCGAYRDVALVGTKGYCFEGPFWINARGRIVGWDEREEAHAKKLVERELQRLRLSFEAARADGFPRFVMFLHYPPTSILEDESGFTAMAEEYGAEQVIYAHCHGEARFHDSVMGPYRGVNYSLVSGDYRRWMPMKVLD